MHELKTFDEFERDWLRRHRGSIPRKRRVSSASAIFWIVFWLCVAMGAAIFSAAHTIPAAEMTLFRDNPNRADIAKLLFTFLEASIFGGAALRRKISWLRWVMWGALLVALAANIGSSMLAVMENQGGLLIQFVGVLLSILAPLSALAAGEVLHIHLDELKALHAAADEEYSAAQKQLNAKINTAYKHYEKEEKERIAKEEADKRALAALSAVSASDLTDSRQTRPANYGYVSTPDGQIKVMAYLDDNPDAVNMGSRALAALVGVSHDTANKGRNAWAAKQNGHSKTDRNEI